MKWSFPATLCGLFLLFGTAQAAEPISSEALIGALEPVTGETSRSVDLDILFRSGSASLSPRAYEQLDTVGFVLSMEKFQGLPIGIFGHTDATGSASSNKILSEKRAGAVMRYLRDNFNLDMDNFSVAGFGEEQLRYPHTPNASANRRVEIVVFMPELIEEAPEPENEGETSVISF